MKKKMSHAEALAKARAARASGTAKKKARPMIPTWKAPSDFKPFFAEILVRTDKDGLLSPKIKVVRYQGRYDPEADDRKKFVMNDYDPSTVSAILSRLSMVTFVTNVNKRLPKFTTFKLVVRVMSKKTQGNILGTTLRQIFRATKLKSGKIKAVELDKSDLDYRKFRKAFRCILPSAFQSCLLPPKRTRGAKKAEE